MIEVEHLAKTYGALSAIRDVSFTVATGEACGFLGPNGAGKTTTMRIITGFMPATSGTVRVEGFDVFEDPIDVRRRIGYLPEHPPLYLEMRVRAYLDHVARLRGISGARVKTARDAVISDCGLEAVTDRLCGHLSKGYRQRVGLAQALIHNPAVLVLDEPTIGLDPAQIMEIRELIRQLATERTVVLSTHILAEVAQTCRKVVIINRGHVALEADLSNLTQRGSLESEYLRCVSGDDVSLARTNHA
jgi:ABC-2 type transport system ATP-binding protein